MKCVKKADEVKRVEDIRALSMVDQGWAYCKKSEWKKKGAKQSEDAPVAAVKKEKTGNKKVKKSKVAENTVNGQITDA